MCFFSTPSGPGAPPLPPPPPVPPSEVDPAIKAARDEAKRRAAALRGYASTIATSGLGTAPPPNTTSGGMAAGAKALLGQ